MATVCSSVYRPLNLVVFALTGCMRYPDSICSWSFEIRLDPCAVEPLRMPSVLCVLFLYPVVLNTSLALPEDGM